MKILITAPSLETSQNVSGISSVVRQIVGRGRAEFVHFRAGRRDDEKKSVVWIIKQFGLAPRFYQLIQREKIDLVHLNTALNPLSIVRDYVLTRAARQANCPVLLHIHGGKFLTKDFDNKFYARLAEQSARLASIVVVLSEAEKEIIERRWRGVNARVLENAVALDEVQPRKDETSEKTIIFLGRIDEAKGLREITEACRVLKAENFEFRFECYGAGRAKDAFAAEMSEILGEKFYYGGVVAGAEKWKALSRADIFLLPSHFEGLPMSLLEAMAAGCVAVASDVGSVGTVIKDGVNGFTVEPKNVAQIVEKLKLLLSNQADRQNLRNNARKTVERDFNFDTYIENLERIYAEIKSVPSA